MLRLGTAKPTPRMKWPGTSEALLCSHILLARYSACQTCEPSIEANGNTESMRSNMLMRSAPRHPAPTRSLVACWRCVGRGNPAARYRVVLKVMEEDHKNANLIRE